MLDLLPRHFHGNVSCRRLVEKIELRTWIRDRREKFAAPQYPTNPHRTVLVENNGRAIVSLFEQRPHPKLQPLQIDTYG